MGNISTEIRSFYSIKEIDEILEGEITQYREVVDEYSQWLGSFLRDSENAKESEEHLKKMQALRKGKQEKPGKKGKSKKSKESPLWIQFKELKLSASEHGEAEMLFDAIEDINLKVERLEKVRDSLTQLEKSGLGKDITYLGYIRDGVLEKITLRHKKDEEFAQRFQYLADFSIMTEI